MSKVLEKLKAEAKRFEEKKESRGTEFTKINIFKPAIGDNMIRILPHWDASKRENDEELFFVRRVIHFLPKTLDDGRIIPGIPMACLQHVDKECPACIAYDRLRRAKDEKATDLRPAERFIYNIIDYGEKGKREPQLCVWTASYTQQQDILDMLTEAGRFWDLSNGRDWKLKKVLDSKKGKRFGTSYKLMPRMQESAVPKKILEMIEEGMTDLSKVYAEDSERDIIAALESMGIEVERPKSKVSASVAKAKAAAKPRDEDDEEEVEEEAPRKKSKPAAVKKAPPPDDDDDDEAEESDDDGFMSKDDDLDTGKRRHDDDTDLNDELKKMGI